MTPDINQISQLPGNSTNVNPGTVSTSSAVSLQLSGNSASFSIQNYADVINGPFTLDVNVLLSGINSNTAINNTYDLVYDLRGHPTLVIDKFVTKMDHVGIIITDTEYA